MFFPHIDEMIKRNIIFNSIGIIGGEPFLHSDITNFSNEIKSRYKFANIMITTNGFWLNRYKEYNKLFSIISRFIISIYEPIEKSIGGRNKIIEIIKNISSSHPHIKFEVRGPVNKFGEVQFSSEPIKPTKYCHWQSDCTNLLPNGRLARCGVGAYANKNPNVTKEFLSDNKDMFYDLTVDDGRSFKEWKEKYPLKACYFCNHWQTNLKDWQNASKKDIRKQFKRLF
jgi:hypothetical protein